MHSQETFDLLRDHPKAFLLLSYIALRARHQPDIHPTKGIGPRQALIGDFRACGLQTEAEYRAAKKQLASDGLATFTGTSKGTIATLCSSDVYHVEVTSGVRPEQHDNNDQNNRHTTTKLEYRTKNIENRSEGTMSDSPFKLEHTVPEVDRFHPCSRQILRHLNSAASRSYRETEHNLSLISERLEEADVTFDGVKQMINRMVRIWGNDIKMSKYLCPDTLFRASNFGRYYDERELATDTRIGPDYEAGF